MSAQIDYRPHYTYSDYAKWEGAWELIQGMPYAMSPAPTYWHQLTTGYIHDELLDALGECSECKAVLAVDWKIDEETVLQPDNIVICGPVTERFLTHAPALIFEILSPSTAYKDRHLKHQIFEAEGVRHYVLVDIKARVVEIFELKEGTFQKRTDLQEGTIDFDLGPCTIEVDIGRFWR